MYRGPGAIGQSAAARGRLRPVCRIYPVRTAVQVPRPVPRVPGMHAAMPANQPAGSAAAAGCRQRVASAPAACSPACVPAPSSGAHALEPSGSAAAIAMDSADIFKFDLNGYIVLRGVLTAAEVTAANRAIDKHMGEMNGLEACQDMLGWAAGDRHPFVSMLAHKRIVPFLNTLCGSGFRCEPVFDLANLEHKRH